MKFSDYILLNEGTSGYWPGYASDTTADILTEIRKKTSVTQNIELKKFEDKWLKEVDKIKLFWKKHDWVNIVLTSLQDGFFIKKELIDKCKKYLSELIDQANEEILESSYELFISTLKTTLNELNKLKINNEFYAPGFLDKWNRKEMGISS